ncbi:uncharacterized protein LOC111069521 [Drosophila obscura]|uniref:uncharacterized protein LOC111069521 n=1 Tax=Drosophila obscura TaxID=7282 RepID=UPI001BB25C85|nr:uncharacterized protein LOC111069521 [Drosophila obscura]
MWRLSVFVLWLALQTICFSHVTFTNLKCVSLDEKFMGFSACQIKAVNRTHKYLDVYTKIHQFPINTAGVKVKFMKFDHGYKPFFIDISYDGCKFMREKKKHPIALMFYSSFASNSNLNHTCPYNHDIGVNKLYTGELETDLSRLIPIASGDYAVFTEWSTDNTVRCSIRLYLKIKRN